MKIIVQCECSNQATFSVPYKKNLLMRDNFENRGFYCEDKSEKIVLLQCSKCKNWITLDMN